MKKIKYLLFILISIQHIFAQVPSYVPTDGLIAYYPFNGNANDESGNGNDGLVDGATLITDRFGNDNSAYEFDGINNSITITNQFFDNGYGSYAINLWFSCNDIDQTMQNIYNTIPHNGEGLTFNHENSPENMSHWKNSNTSGGSSWDILAANPFEYSPFLNSTAYMITVVKSESTYSYYVNGVLDKTTEINLSAQNQFTGMIFGENAYGNESFNGILDDIGIWNRALTEQEITNLYNSETLSIDDQNLTNILIYPNPVVNKLFIQGLTGPIKVTVYNILGELVLSKTTSSEINVGNLQRGIYIVEIINEQKTTVKKFIKN